MILILTDDDEPTTDLVIDWLKHLDKNFIRISYRNSLSILKIYNSPSGFEVIFKYKMLDGNYCEVDTSNIKSYWYRRSNMTALIPEITSGDSQLKISLTNHLNHEYNSALKILDFVLCKKNRINKFSDNHIQKLDVLEKARKSGLNIPDTLVCTTKNELLHFYNKYDGNIITKTIGDPSALYYIDFHCFTSKVIIEDIPEKFALSLFQQNIDKDYELRVFFLNNKFYSSAVFSQSDKQTSVDFRHYNHDTPNRVVPHKLDPNLKNKLSNLMQDCNLNSGSIDLIYSKKNKYIFLEVNPIGQFEQVSFPCNYNLFKEIALTL